MRLNRTRLKTSLAVRHARSIRLGLRDMFPTQELVDNWFALHNLEADQQTAVSKPIARDWVRLNMPKVEPTRLNSALGRLYADSWVLGEDMAIYDVAKAEKVNKAAPTDKQLKNSLQVNWNKWNAGKRATKQLEDPSPKLKQLLDNRLFLIQEISNTTMNRIGTVLATALEQGKTPKQVAILIDKVINDPIRALTIAQTEMSYAVIEASRQMYYDSGVEEIEYIAQDPCDECAENEDASPIGVDEEFPNGNPPVHPNCMCDVIPYTPDNQN